MKRKLLIDVTVLAQGIRTGVYRVTDEVVKCLVRDEAVDVFFTVTQEAFFTDNHLDLRAGLMKYGAETGISAPFIDSETDPAFTDIDVYISPFFKVPDRWAAEERVRKVVIAYDLIAILHPEYCEETTIAVLSEFYAQIGEDWLVFAISESTKADLLQHRPDLKPDNVTVLPLGVDEKFSGDFPGNEVSAVKAKYAIPADKPYILSVATLEVRKNLITVLDAYAQYIESSGDVHTNLVLTGMQGWKLEQLTAELEKRPALNERVILTGFVEEQNLPALYGGASVFVFMSFYEGFGLPPLEAMRSGVPVITSNTSSLPEVVGEAGIMLAPTDIKGIAEALGDILSNDDFRAGLAEKALARAAQFSWEKCCAAFTDHIRELPLSSSPYLSIITICLNEESIRDTCMSVAEQSYGKFEWIVVDGGSDDATLQVLNEYRDHMACFISEKDEGRYDAMNKGILNSKGKYLLFLNGGDYLYQQDTLEKIFRYSVPFNMMSLFQLKLNAPVIYGEVATRETGLMPYPMWKTGKQHHDMAFFAGNSLPHQATFIRRELFEKYGSYDTSLKYAADYEWFIRVLVGQKMPSQYLPSIVSVYNFEGVSSISIAADAPHIMEIQTIYKHYASSVNTPRSKAEGKHEFDIDYCRQRILSARSKLNENEGRVLLKWLELLLIHRKSNSEPAIPLIRKPADNNIGFNALEEDIRHMVRLSADTSSIVERMNCTRCLWYLFEMLKSLQPETGPKKDDEADEAIFIANNMEKAMEQGDTEAIITLAYWRFRGRLPGEREISRWRACIENGAGITEFLSRFENNPRSRKYQLQRNILLEFGKERGLNVDVSLECDRYTLVQQALRDTARRNKFGHL